MILVNCADIKNYNDAGMLSSFTDGTALIMNQGEVRRQVTSHTITPLMQKKVNIVGVVLNNYTYAIPKIIYKIV